MEEITHASGSWTIYFLLTSLAITPLRRFTGIAQLIQARRAPGLFSFFYACLHLLAWVWLDKFFDWIAITEDLTEKRFLFVGMDGFAALLPPGHHLHPGLDHPPWRPKLAPSPLTRLSRRGRWRGALLLAREK
ncbi:MAG TPA: ferric reductase-like transmembrane domain-containing protein [Bryobacteraceae bacterium]|nr:ferric reductase-like transmembrane domain-containing protein [Bryobacteraceae bacterium]